MTYLNTAIAKYKHIYKNNYKGYDFPVFVFNDAIWKIPPDYEHDARLYMALFEEMGKNNNYFLMLARSDVPGSTWECCYGGNFEDVSYSDTIGTAICLAYCKLKGIEVVG